MLNGPSTHYAWIDFSIYHCLQNPAASNQLQAIQAFTFPSTCLYFPGCWQKIAVLWDQINWRFCGGFFLGDKKSLIDLYEHFVQVYTNLPNLTWEVNVWAFIENRGRHFDWYPGDHNNSILNIPMPRSIEASDPKTLAADDSPPHLVA